MCTLKLYLMCQILVRTLFYNYYWVSFWIVAKKFQEKKFVAHNKKIIGRYITPVCVIGYCTLWHSSDWHINTGILRSGAFFIFLTMKLTSLIIVFVLFNFALTQKTAGPFSRVIYGADGRMDTVSLLDKMSFRFITPGRLLILI